VTGAQPALLEILDRDPDDDVRIRAARALGRIGLPSALPALVRATDSSQPMALRAVAARALGDLGGPGPVEFLEVLLGDPDYRVSTNAGQSMTRVGAAGLARLRQLSRQPGDAGDCAREALAVHAVTHGLVLEASAPLATVPPAQRSGSSVAAGQDGTDAEVSVT
jgi:HEAT repeat protein